MVDFHSHILPGIDDGSQSVEQSLEMLSESWKQGVDIIFATPHFYADQEDPASFIERRNEAYRQLREAIDTSTVKYPEIRLGAEVLYFPGISGAGEVKKLFMGDLKCILIEPPMMQWSDSMLDEIEETGRNLGCIPVIAHIDRYMRMLSDRKLIDRVKDRRLLVQVNASFFIHNDTVDYSIELMNKGKIHFIGSDCHNTTSRAPNLGTAAESIFRAGRSADFARFNKRVYSFVGDRL